MKIAQDIITALRRHIDGVEQLEEMIGDLEERLDHGRDYLMQVTSSAITVEDTFEAFGWTRDGFNK